MPDSEIKLPLRDKLKELTAECAADHEYCRGYRDAAIRALKFLDETKQSEDAPTSYTPATEDEVKLALEEYQDCSEYNSDRVNMKAALDAVLYRRGSTVQAECRIEGVVRQIAARIRQFSEQMPSEAGNWRQWLRYQADELGALFDKPNELQADDEVQNLRRSVAQLNSFIDRKGLMAEYEASND